MPGNTANHGYLKGLAFKELSAGRECEITGSMLIHIKNLEEYKTKKERLVGKFGEVISRSSGTSYIATRVPPPWAEKKIDEVIWDCDEMIRWDVPINDR